MNAPDQVLSEEPSHDSLDAGARLRAALERFSSAPDIADPRALAVAATARAESAETAAIEAQGALAAEREVSKRLGSQRAELSVNLAGVTTEREHARAEAAQQRERAQSEGSRADAAQQREAALVTQVTGLQGVITGLRADLERTTAEREAARAELAAHLAALPALIAAAERAEREATIKATTLLGFSSSGAVADFVSVVRDALSDASMPPGVPVLHLGAPA